MEPAPVRVGVLGCGNVGAALLTLIDEQRSEVARRTGLALEVRAVAVRDSGRVRDVSVDSTLFTDDPELVVSPPRARPAQLGAGRSSNHSAALFRRRLSDR